MVVTVVIYSRGPNQFWINPLGTWPLMALTALLALSLYSQYCQNMLLFFHMTCCRFTVAVSAPTTLRAWTVSSAMTSIMTCPGDLRGAEKQMLVKVRSLTTKVALHLDFDRTTCDMNKYCLFLRPWASLLSWKKLTPPPVKKIFIFAMEQRSKMRLTWF